MSIDVKLTHKDEDTGARVVEVKLSSSNSFETPTRSITSTEHHYKVGIIERIVSSSGLGQGPQTAFDNEIFQISKQHDVEQLQRYSHQNGVFHNAKKDVVALKNTYFDKFLIYYPIFSNKMLYEEKQTVGIENLKTLIDFQTNAARLENISIPESHPNQPFDSFKRDLTSLSKRALAYGGKQIIPYLDLGMEASLFKQKYDYLIDIGSPIIGTAYRNYSKHYPNFRYLQQRDDDVLIVCSGVDRYWHSDWTTAYMHIPNFWGVDITSLESRPAPVTPDPKPVDEIKRFDQNSIGIIKLKKHNEIYGSNLHCNCPVCSGKSLEQFQQDYSTNSNGEIDTHILDKFCKLHEAYASKSEFENERAFIKQNDTKSYIDSHSFLSNFFQKNRLNDK